MADLDRLDALARAYDAAVHRIRQDLTAFASQMWASMPDYRDEAIEAMAQALAPRVLAGQLQTAELTRAYLIGCASELGLTVTVPAIDREAVTGMRGVDPLTVYQRPGMTTWTALSRGKTLDQAVSAGGLRLTQLIGGDLQNAKRVQSRDTMRATGGRYYRRILTGRENCALCVIASTQRYHVENLLPIHPGCDCNVGPLPAGMAVEQVIDEETLEAAHKAVEARTGASDRGGRLPEYKDIILTTEHGEYGPVISFKETRQDRRKASAPKASTTVTHTSPRSAGEPRWLRPGGSGKVDVPEGTILQDHEVRTAQALADLGHTVRFRVVNNTPGVKNPDVEIDGEIWEFKAPRGASEKNTISDQFKKARKQASRLVIDLRRCGLSDGVAIEQIERRFRGQSRITRVIVISHDGTVAAFEHR